MLAFLPPSDGIIAFFEELIESIGPVHILEEFALHFILCEPIKVKSIAGTQDPQNLLHKVEHDSLWHHINHCPLDDVVVRVDQKFYKI